MNIVSEGSDAENAELIVRHFAQLLQPGDRLPDQALKAFMHTRDLRLARVLEALRFAEGRGWVEYVRHGQHGEDYFALTEAGAKLNQ